jgi:hypothetical protein
VQRLQSSTRCEERFATRLTAAAPTRCSGAVSHAGVPLSPPSYMRTPQDLFFVAAISNLSHLFKQAAPDAANAGALWHGCWCVAPPEQPALVPSHTGVS